MTAKAETTDRPTDRAPRRPGRKRINESEAKIQYKIDPNETLGTNVFNDLVARIEAGEYAPGGRLPSTRALGNMYAVSTTVVWDAIRQMKSRGIAYGEEGRGTFIVDGRQLGRLALSGRGTGPAGEDLADIDATWTRKSNVLVDTALASRLGVPADTELRIVGIVQRIDGAVAWTAQVLFVNRPDAEGWDGEGDGDGDVLPLLRLDDAPIEINPAITMRPVSGVESQSLSWPSGSRVFVTTQTGRTFDGQPLFVADYCALGHRVTLTADLQI